MRKQDYEAEFEIRDSVVARLRSRTGDDQSSRLRSPRGKVNIHPTTHKHMRIEHDLIWVEDDETVQGENRTMLEDHRIMTVRLVAEVRNKDPELGPDEARRLALVASSELTKNDAGDEERGPRLGLGYVSSVSFRRSVRDISLADGVYSHIVECSIGYRALR